jgi:hypothetical protein
MFFLLSLYYHAYLHSFLGLSETFVWYRRHLAHLAEHETVENHWTRVVVVVVVGGITVRSC